MKIITLLVLVSASAFATESYTRGYQRKDGTYVQGHYKTNPDNTVNNNYGTRGNVNPHTGSYGTQPRNEAQPQGAYNSGNGMGNSYGNSYGNSQGRRR